MMEKKMTQGFIVTEEYVEIILISIALWTIIIESSSLCLSWFMGLKC